MKIVPLGDRVLVKVKESEKRTPGGLILPAGSQEKTQSGTVVAVGSDESICVKVNDEVIYDKYAGSSLQLDDTEHLLLSQSDVLAVVQD